ncbi:U3 small nucleolar RNA-associated protein 6 family protein [Leishmania donovani]|uniref:U3 small nucleolar RNA-associated protein 6 family protein n=1 Tax=Leishmania donovani TaxID=5661 RepID=A0A504XBE0_LEIDO|nr:U3 small nucleolar RNA-associated protein 6 family protein [Leishmania donovani]
MARARAIETRLEKLVPALDEYYTSGFLTREETVEVSRQRQHWEFRLVAKPLLLLDVRGAIKYELGLEKRLREYCIYTKLNLQHRWDIVDRIEGIYKIGLKHLRSKAEHEALRQECVLFMKQFQRNGSLSNLYGELMVMHPRRSDIWVEAAEWQGFSQRNIDNARAIIQQALLTMSSEPVVWACALRVELKFVQRLLEGLLAEHREEVRKARKRAAKAAEDGDEENRADDAVAAAEEEEATSAIAPKLRAENEDMAHVLLDLALAKTVVEEAFRSPASGAVLLEQLLAVAGAYAFAREVVELAVTTAARKMAEACSGSADVTVEAARVCGARGASASSSLTIASDQQRLRVRTQWRHRHSIDTVFAHYLALEDLIMNRYTTAIVDTTTYLASGGSGGDRRRAAVKAVVSLMAFSFTPTSALSELPGIVAADTDSTKRFPAVRRAFAEALRRVAALSAEGVSRVCTHLLRTPPTAAAGSAASTTTTNKSKRKAARQTNTTLDIVAAAQWLLGQPQLDKATLQDCVTEPRERTERLLREVASAADMHPPAKSRARHEAPVGTAGATALMTWSIVQLEQFLQSEDRDALVQGAGGGFGGSASAPPYTPLKTATAMTTEDVERFIVWWKEEEALLRGQQEEGGDSGDALAASRTRRRLAVMKLLHQHGLLPSVDMPASAEKSSGSKKVPKSGSSDAASEDAWAKTQDVLLNRSSALQFVQVAGTTAPARLPLSLWRVFSALEKLEGPTQMREKAPSAHAAYAEASSSSTRLSSFAAAGLLFLSGVPHSALSREEEWARLEGVTSLLRCRLFSWLGRRVCTRDTVAETLQRAESDLAEAWIVDVQGLLTLAQRCQPLPRFAQTHCVLPFLEGVARDAVQAAREAYEALLQLYDVSKHPESFLPLLYDGTSAKKLAQQAGTTSSVCFKASTAEVQRANAEDWVAYVLFERTVSKDLLRAKTVVEQARRASLAPQIFMVMLNAL